jgi:hypothetical protein
MGSYNQSQNNINTFDILNNLFPYYPNKYDKIIDKVLKLIINI